MTTVPFDVADTRRTVARRTLHDHAIWWLSAILATTLLGFQRTITTNLTRLDLAHAAHGVASLGWLLVLIAQAVFIRRAQRSAHRQLAVLGVAFAMLLSITALPMLQATGAGASDAIRSGDARGATIRISIIVLDVGLLIMFLGLFATAVANVRRSTVHARAMAATAFIALPPGLGRWYMRLAQVDPVVGSYLALGTGALCLAALTWSDRHAGVRERVYPAMGFAMLGLAALCGPITQRVMAVMADAPR